MGRKKLTWKDLKNRGAKSHRWQSRQVEQRREDSAREAILAYVSAFAQEESSFAERCKAGETVCRQLDSSIFNWPETHYLTMCRDFARKSIEIADPKKPWTLKLSQRFLRHFSKGEATVIDPVAADNIRLMSAAFLEPDSPMNHLRLLALVEFWSVKSQATGKYILPDRQLLDFHPDDIRMQDAAIFAIRDHSDANSK